MLQKYSLLQVYCFVCQFKFEISQIYRHEALVAAIAEKDAHIALLEQSRERPREEIETLRHHKEKLMEKLKEENERRAQLLSSADMTMSRLFFFFFLRDEQFSIKDRPLLHHKVLYMAGGRTLFIPLGKGC